jgi:hypothetical protein
MSADQSDQRRGLADQFFRTWPVPDVTTTDRGYYRDFTSGRPVPDLIVELGRSKVTLGYTQMQGYLFSAARPAREIRTMLGSGEACVTG